MKPVNLLIIAACLEKLLQHALTALFFVVTIPGIGTPSAGTTILLGNSTMAFLNIIVFLLFAAGLYGFIRMYSWGIVLVAGMAAADIILEFAFHGLFFITVSVIVPTVLIAACWIVFTKAGREPGTAGQH